MPRPRPRTVILPSIMQVLQEGQYQNHYTEGVSNVIKWADIDPIPLSPPTELVTRPKTPLSDLMKTIDLRDNELDPSNDDEERFSYIVCFPQTDTLNDSDDLDVQGTCPQRPITACGSSQVLQAVPFWKNNVVMGLTKAAAKIIMPAKSRFKRVQH